MPRVRRATPRPRPQVSALTAVPGDTERLSWETWMRCHTPQGPLPTCRRWAGQSLRMSPLGRDSASAPAPDSGGLAAEPGAGQGASQGTRPRWCRVKCQGKLWEVPRQIPERLLAPAYNTGNESDAEHPHRGSHATLGARHQVLSGCLWLGRALLGTLLSPEGGVVTH